MNQYYYFAATLPMLAMDAPPPMSVDAFLDQCRRHLSAGDAEAAEAVLAAPGPCAHPAAQAWSDRATQFANAVARQRAQRTRRDPGPFLRPFAGDPAAVDAAVAAAFAAASPLERERALDRARWAMAEELAGWETFSASAVIMYGVRLRIAARWAALSEETGEARARAVVDAPAAAAEEPEDR